MSSVQVDGAYIGKAKPRWELAGLKKQVDCPALSSPWRARLLGLPLGGLSA